MERLTNERKLYFAHPWVKRFDPMKAQMIRGLEKLGWEIFDPLDPSGVTKEENEKFGGEFYETPITDERVRYIVERDYTKILEADVLFAWVPSDAQTVGTICEILFAHRLRKRIIIISDRPSPWLWFYASRSFMRLQFYPSFSAYQQNHDWEILQNSKHQATLWSELHEI